MIAKKNPKADLEKKRFAFFQIGLILSGSLCLAAFEYSTAKLEETAFVQSNFNNGPTIDEPLTDVLINRPQQKTPTKILDDIIVVKEPVVDPAPFVDTTTQIIVVDPDPTPDPFSGGGGVSIILPEPPMDFPEVEPMFPGGTAEMARYINENIELPNYIPDYDQGTVYVRFVVNKDGSIQDVEIARGLSRELNKAAIDVVKGMQPWIPGEQAGKPVRVRFTLPIRINLR